MLLHLSNPDEIQRLATLPPLHVMRELARIDVGHGAAPAAPAPKAPILSKAKPPIQPLGSSSVATDEPPDPANFEAHVRYWYAQDRKGRRR